VCALWWGGEARGDEISDLIQSGKTPVQEQRDKEIQAPGIGIGELDLQWRLRRGVTQEEALDEKLLRYRVAMRHLSLSNAPKEATVLLSEAGEALKAGDVPKAQKRVAQAREVAPALPAVEFAQADLTFQTEPLALFRGLGQLAAGYGKAWAFLPSRFAWLTNDLVALLVALSAFVGLFAGLVSVRHLSKLAADLARLLPKGVTQTQLVLGACVLIAAPGVLTGSPLVSALVAVVLVAAYLSWSERAAALVVLASVAVLPQLAQLGSAGVQFAGTEVGRLASWGSFGCLQDCEEHVKAATEEKAAGDKRVVWARGFLDASRRLTRGKREEYAQVQKDFEALALVEVGPHGQGAALNNQGVAQAMQGDLDGAYKTFQRSAQVFPRSYGPLLNMSRVLELRGDRAGAEKLVQEAIKVGGEAAAQRSQFADRVLGSYFTVEEMPTEPLFEAHMEGATQGAAPTLSFWGRVGGVLPLDTMPLLVGGGGALFVVLSLLGLLAKAAQACPSCGQPMVPGGEGLQGEVRGKCRACHLCFEEKVGIEYHARIKHEERVLRFGAAKKVVLWAGNALVPGLGSAWRGASAGVWLMLVACLGAALLLVRDWPLRDPWRLGPLWNDGHAFCGAALLGVAFVLSLTQAWLTPSGAPQAGASKGPAKGRPAPAAKEA